MNKQVALLGIIEIISSLTLGIFILIITYRLVKVYGIKKLQIDHSNTAYNILIAAVLFAVGYIVSGVVEPIVDAFRLLAKTDISSVSLTLKFLAFGGLYIAIAYTLSIVISLLSVYTYTRITPLDEPTEIKNNNIGVGILIASIIIILSLFTKSGIVILVESLVPYPDLPPSI